MGTLKKVVPGVSADIVNTKKFKCSSGWQTLNGKPITVNNVTPLKCGGSRINYQCGSSCRWVRMNKKKSKSGGSTVACRKDWQELAEHTGGGGGSNSNGGEEETCYKTLFSDKPGDFCSNHVKWCIDNPTGTCAAVQACGDQPFQCALDLVHQQSPLCSGCTMAPVGSSCYKTLFSAQPGDFCSNHVKWCISNPGGSCAAGMQGCEDTPFQCALNLVHEQSPLCRGCTMPPP